MISTSELTETRGFIECRTSAMTCAVNIGQFDHVAVSNLRQHFCVQVEMIEYLLIKAHIFCAESCIFWISNY